MRTLAAWVAVGLGSTALLLARDPFVYNVKAAQRPDTELVDISYSVMDPDSAWLAVTVEVSSDGGSTWTVPCGSCSGDLGPGIPTGASRAIVWDAGADWDASWSAHMRVRITADDRVGPPPAEEFAEVPGGSFTMGDSLDEGDADEQPTRVVTLTAFHLGRHEVTKALWDEVAAWAADHGYTDLGPGQGKGDLHPVGMVDWNDVLKWCNARSERDKLTPCYKDAASATVLRAGRPDSVTCAWSSGGYRLPTEAEWECGARGGQPGTRFPWGDTITHDQANYYSTSLYAYDESPTRGYHPLYDDGSDPRTSPVGAFAANGYGLLGTSGNVWEWCWDWYGATAYATPAGRDPRGPASGVFRVTRGGAYSSRADGLRLADRHSDLPAARFTYLGLRLARGAAVTGRTHAGMSPHFAVETRAATAPQGVLSVPVDTAAQASTTGWWDVSGVYALTALGRPLALTLLHDARGRITGTATYTAANGAVVSMPTKGAMKGPAGTAVLTLTLKGRDTAKTASVALALNLTVNATKAQLEGALTGTVTVDGVRAAVDEDVTLPIAPPMDGSWLLAFSLTQEGTRISGTATLAFSSGTHYAYRVKGSLDGTAAVLSLAADSADPGTKGFPIRTTITPREGGGATLDHFSATGYGQTLGW